MKRKADWMAWTLQLIVGFVAGGILGIFLSSSRRRGTWLEEGCVFPFILGVALLTAAFASHFGDRMWTPDDFYKIFPPEEPQQDGLSIYWSVVIGVVGVGLIGFALLRTFGVL